MAEKITNIGGRLHDASVKHTVTGANEVMDDNLEKKQDVINAEQQEININQSQINDKLRHYTKMAHIRIDAEEITREHNDNLLNEEINAKQLEIGAVETDIEPIPNSPNMLPSGAIAFNLGYYYGNDNPEWLYVMVDGAMRIIGGVKKDGSIDWMIGIPKPVKEYIEGHIQECLDELHALAEHVDEELEKKEDKVEGKSLIDEEYASGISYIENTEYVKVVTDAEGRILYGVNRNGDFVDGKGSIETACEVSAKLDHIDIGIDVDNGVLRICGKLYKLISYEGDADIFDGNVSDYSRFIESTAHIENPEFKKAIVDQEERILYGYRYNGTEYFPDLSGYTIDGVPVSKIIINLR